MQSWRICVISAHSTLEERPSPESRSVSEIGSIRERRGSMGPRSDFQSGGPGSSPGRPTKCVDCGSRRSRRHAGAGLVQSGASGCVSRREGPERHPHPGGYSPNGRSDCRHIPLKRSLLSSLSRRGQKRFPKPDFRGGSFRPPETPRRRSHSSGDPRKPPEAEPNLRVIACQQFAGCRTARTRRHCFCCCCCCCCCCCLL